jgi:putative heme-binding domain-containing protein
MLAANNDQDNYLRHAGSLALARIGEAAPVTALSAHPSRAVRIAAVLVLRRMREPGIRVFLKDADEFIVTETARAINDDHSIPDALPDLARSLADHRFRNEALVRRAINANLRGGTSENIELLANYIRSEAAPAAFRNEAMDALSTWAKPSVLDRVDGRFRGEVKRDPAPVQKMVSPVLLGLLTNRDASVRQHAARAMGKLQILDAKDALMTSLVKDASPEVRAEALKAMSKLPGVSMDLALKQAIADRAKPVRVAGLDLLQRSSLSRTLVVDLLDQVIQKGTPEEKQAAITTLGTLPFKDTEKTLTGLVDKVEKNTLSPEVYFELSDALDSAGSEVLKKRYQSLARTGSADSLQSAFKPALSGGDARRGEAIFWSNSSAQCVRCHALNDYGGNVGPTLTGVSSRLTKEQLLQALIEPSARIAPGYGIVSLETNGGQKLNGILQKETADHYLMRIGSGPDTIVLKKDVKTFSAAASSMPPMHLLLSKKEIRDLVAFLYSLKKVERSR